MSPCQRSQVSLQPKDANLGAPGNQPTVAWGALVSLARATCGYLISPPVGNSVGRYLVHRALVVHSKSVRGSVDVAAVVEQNATVGMPSIEIPRKIV